MVLDVFLSHAWRFHPEWTLLSGIIERNFSNLVRNFSLPWHDPAISPSSEYGNGFLTRQIEVQIMPVEFVFMITELFDTASNMKWLEKELDFAKNHSKQVIYVSSRSLEISINPDTNNSQSNSTSFEEFLTSKISNC